MLIIIISGSNRILSYDICGKKKNKLLDFMRKPYIYIYTVTISHKDNKILALLSAFEKEEINLPKILAINTLYDYTYTSTCL